MPAKSKSKYRKAARLRVLKQLPQWKCTLEAGIHANESIAKSQASNTFKNNEILKSEIARLEAIEYDDLKQSKLEKLDADAKISRGLQEKIAEYIEDPDRQLTEKDITAVTKLIDSWNKIGKRDDVLQGHQIQAETNPQDKADAAVSGWFLEVQAENDRLKEQLEEKQADVIDVEAE